MRRAVPLDPLKARRSIGLVQGQLRRRDLTQVRPIAI